MVGRCRARDPSGRILPLGRTGGLTLTQITIASESDGPRGWEFEVVYRRPGVPDESRTLTLSWADYDFLSRGALPPADVARTLAQFHCARIEPEAIKARTDASEIRRRFPEVDELFRPGGGPG